MFLEVFLAANLDQDALVDQTHLVHRLQVTRNTFAKALPLVEKALERCHFYAFDLEMTGLHVVDKREDFLDDIQDRYEVVCTGSF